MRTEQQHGGPGAGEKTAHWLSKAAPSARATAFNAVWQRYCEVVRELDMTAAELQALRDRVE